MSLGWTLQISAETRRRGEAGPEFTLEGDLAGANQVTLVAHEDDGSLRLRLPQEESQLGGAVETAPVGHWKHQDAHLAQQRRQVLSDRMSEGWFSEMISSFSVITQPRIRGCDEHI